ncbi:MAG: phage portal protein [Clostridium sp.]|jgi:SPP1 family phage portal protein|nr:phage portal protein [Clostridium sp.]
MELFPYRRGTTEVDAIIRAAAPMGDKEILALEVQEFLKSPERKEAIDGENYYLNHTVIRSKKRTLANGEELKNRANHRLEHAFYPKMVDELVGYLCSKLPSITSNADSAARRKAHEEAIGKIIDESFWRVFSRWCKNAVNHGCSWLFPYIDKDGSLRFSNIAGYEVRALWRDGDHQECDGVIRVYDVIEYVKKTKMLVTHVDYVTTNGIAEFVYENGALTPIRSERGNGHFYLPQEDGTAQARVWDRLPAIPLRFNDVEQPLISRVRANIDAYNLCASNFADMLADLPLAIVKVVGYQDDPDTTLRNLKQLSVVYLQEGGDAGYITPDLATDSVETQLTRIRRDIFSFGAGVDGQDDGQQNRSGVALAEKRSDLDIIANIFENQIQAAFREVIWFVSRYLLLIGGENYTDCEITLTLNRDIMTNESAVITACKESVGILPDVQIRANHPWSNDNTEALWQEQENGSAEDEEPFAVKAATDETDNE